MRGFLETFCPQFSVLLPQWSLNFVNLDRLSPLLVPIYTSLLISKWDSTPLVKKQSHSRSGNCLHLGNSLKLITSQVLTYSICFNYTKCLHFSYTSCLLTPWYFIHVASSSWKFLFICQVSVPVSSPSGRLLVTLCLNEIFCLSFP